MSTADKTAVEREIAAHQEINKVALAGVELLDKIAEDARQAQSHQDAVIELAKKAGLVTDGNEAMIRETLSTHGGTMRCCKNILERVVASQDKAAAAETAQPRSNGFVVGGRQRGQDKTASAEEADVVGKFGRSLR